ncbi:DUF3060 domain-containing protein [Hymenobacter armeniacus]|uniref:DUF3060 domain-containing protein n=1 Tax=Hymenobacter armeniacus TaxID=2771358 RepID=A0ABR8JU26_9BACT|nr:DUF3060 domain-containing protein [Hymenobacter armeniacus]MBD2723465.1 DUF3060 domain-containing protein [Hymenobacter armeniacus]
MSQRQLMRLGVALAAVLCGCSQPPEEAEVRSSSGGHRVEVPGMRIERNGDASAVVTSDDTELTIIGNKSVQTRACSGQDVQLQGDDNQATLTGTCQGLALVGNRNRVTLENVATIEVTGNDNTVHWRGTKPEITTIGKGNTVAKAE